MDDNLKEEIKKMLKEFPLLDSKDDFEYDKRDYSTDMVEGLELPEESIPDEFCLEYDQLLKRQYNVGACVSTSVAFCKEVLDNVEPNKPYSQWFLHANRTDEDFQGEGARIREVLKHLKNEGIVLLDDFNVQEDYPRIRDTLHNKYDFNGLLEKAKEHKSSGYIKLEKNEVKKYLYKERTPIFIGITIYENFYKAPYNNGIIPAIPEGEDLGGHRMAIVGYKGDILKIANWWGEWGGQKGYLYLDINSEIIRDFFVLTDKLINKPKRIKYKVSSWDKDPKTGKWIFSPDGTTLVEKGWQQIQGEWYYFKDNFAVEDDWILENNSWYYLKKGSCKMLKNDWLLKNNKWYRFDNNGKMLTGWYQDSNSKWYYLDIEKGYAYTGWVFIEGKYYYFDDTCTMQVGWTKVDNEWFYLEENGSMKTGWLNDNGTWYYLEEQSNGHMGKCYMNCSATIKDKEYTFDEKGKMLENNSEQVSDNCVNFVKSWEGYFAKPYYDCVGVKTLGYGMTGEEIRGINYVSESQASNMLKNLLNNKYAKPIAQDLKNRNIKLKQNEFDALVSMAYNVGTSGVLSSTLYKRICNGVRDNSLTENFQAWSNGGGRRIEGLYKRRTKEAAMFLNADYSGNN